jgi:hypothetical protein
MDQPLAKKPIYIKTIALYAVLHIGMIVNKHCKLTH